MSIRLICTNNGLPTKPRFPHPGIANIAPTTIHLRICNMNVKYNISFFAIAPVTTNSPQIGPHSVLSRQCLSLVLSAPYQPPPRALRPLLHSLSPPLLLIRNHSLRSCVSVHVSRGFLQLGSFGPLDCNGGSVDPLWLLKTLNGTPSGVDADEEVSI